MLRGIGDGIACCAIHSNAFIKCVMWTRDNITWGVTVPPLRYPASQLAGSCSRAPSHYHGCTHVWHGWPQMHVTPTVPFPSCTSSPLSLFALLRVLSLNILLEMLLLNYVRLQRKSTTCRFSGCIIYITSISWPGAVISWVLSTPSSPGNDCTQSKNSPPHLRNHISLNTLFVRMFAQKKKKKSFKVSVSKL